MEAVVPGGAVSDNSPTANPSGHPFNVDVLDARAWLPPSASDGHQFAVATLFAVALHAGFLFGLGGYEDTQVGARGIDFDAMSVEVTFIEATALESRAPRPDVAAGSTGPVEIVEGALSTPERVVSEAKHSDDKPVEEKAERTMKPDPATDPSSVLDREELERPLRDDPVQPKQEQAAPPVPSAPDGGAAASAIDAKGPTLSGTAAARPGDVQRYARSVVQALSRSRPKGLSGAKGTAKISFQISQDGSTISVRIVESTGNPKLDAVVMASLENVKFPPPPQGMTTDQLTYEIPYHFR